METRIPHTGTMKRILALVVLFLAVATPAAHADEVMPPAPSIAYPLMNADGSVAHRVRVSAPRLSWNIRATARWWDQQIPGLVIEVGPCLPDVPCIVVSVGSWDDADMLELTRGATPRWMGLTVFSGTDPLVRQVLLNRETTHNEPYRRRVASHELGHALGLDHHTQRFGLMCEGACYVKTWVWEPTAKELAVVNTYFNMA